MCNCCCNKVVALTMTWASKMIHPSHIDASDAYTTGEFSWHAAIARHNLEPWGHVKFALPFSARAPSHKSQCPAKRQQTVHLLASQIRRLTVTAGNQVNSVKKHDASYSHHHPVHDGQWHDGCQRRREGDGENLSEGASEGQQQPSWKVTQDGESNCPIIGHDHIAA